MAQKSDEPYFSCSLCSTNCSKLDELKSHFKMDHKFIATESRDIKCCKVGCNVKFKTLKNMFLHIRNKHHDSGKKFSDNSLVKLNSLKSLSSTVARLRTSLRVLTDASIDDFIIESDNHAKNVMPDAKIIVKKFIEKNGSVTMDNFNTLSELLELDSCSAYLRSEGHMKAVKENFDYIEPIAIPLGKRTERRFDQKSGKYVFKDVYETFQYVPIIKTIESVLNNDEIRHYIDNEPQSEEGFLKGFQDGNYFKNHPFFKKFPNALRLQIYFDEILVNNPLGTKTFAHKIGVFYFSILNLPRHINSYLGGIFLFAVCFNADIEKYSMFRILSPLMNDPLMKNFGNRCWCDFEFEK